MKIDNSKGWTEAIVAENCSIQEYLKIAGILQISLDISFQNKVSDADSIYWDFTYREKELTLHYNTYVGISIFPKALTNATDSDNQIVMDVSKTLSDDLEKINNPGNFVSKYFEPESNTLWMNVSDIVTFYVTSSAVLSLRFAFL